MTDYFSTPDSTGQIRQSDLDSSLGERLGAQALDAVDPKDSLSGMWFFRRAREANAGGLDQAVGQNGEVDVFGGQSLEEQQRVVDRNRAAIPDTSMSDAKARVKSEGLEGHLKLPDQDTIKTPVLDLLVSEAHERRDREAAIARGPQGFLPGALGLVTSLGAGMIDPINAAAFSIPVLGEARWGRLMASAGDSLFARAGVRTLQGGAQGAVGTAVLQPADWYLHTQDGQDYTFSDALHSVLMGAGMGGLFHAAFGAVGDIRARMKGEPLAGSPEDRMLRSLFEGERGAAAVPEESGAPGFEDRPKAVLDDLPPAAREDAARAAIADVIDGRPVRAAEMLDIAADHDPRVAESVAGDVAGFTTAKGSTYEVGPDGTTVRNKAARPDIGHEGDEGLKPASEKTVYVEPDAAAALSLPEGSRWRVIDHGDGTISLATQNADGGWGISPSARNVPVADNPAAGLMPIELWGKGEVYGRDAYNKAHFGNEITEVRRGSARAGAGLNHGQRAATAAEDPRWKQLADVKPAHDEPQVLAESRAAEETPAPVSAEAPVKSVSAIEQAATSEEERWRRIEAAYTEDERQVVNDALDKIAAERADREQLINDGADCLMAATLGEVA